MAGACARTAAFALLAVLASGSNPLVPGAGMADPHIHIFGDTAYLYAGRDESPTDDGFIMPDWNVWTSDDLVAWRHVTTIAPNQTYMGAPDVPECWAVDVVFRDGVYALFFSNGGNNMGVMTGSTPTLSDVKDALGRPLVSTTRRPVSPAASALPGVTVTNLTRGSYDPTLLTDDDGTIFVMFGVRDGGKGGDGPSHYLMARLKDDDMAALAEPPRVVHFLPSAADGSTMPYNDKSTLHKYNGVYYLSAGSYYATSSGGPYGPFTFRGNANPHTGQSGAEMNTTRSFGDTSQGHGRFFTWRGQWYHVWCEFVDQNNQGVPRSKESYHRWRDSWMT